MDLLLMALELLSCRLRDATLIYLPLRVGTGRSHVLRGTWHVAPAVKVNASLIHICNLVDGSGALSLHLLKHQGHVRIMLLLLLLKFYGIPRCEVHEGYVDTSRRGSTRGCIRCDVIVMYLVLKVVCRSMMEAARVVSGQHVR